MKKLKMALCVVMAIMLAASSFVLSASALNPENKPVTLHITKYQIAQTNGETDKIGTTDSLTGTAADAPEGATPLAGVEFTIFKLGALGTYVSEAQIAEIDDSYDSSASSITFNGTTVVGTSKTTDDNGVADFTVEATEHGVYFVKETVSPDAVTEKASSFVVSLPMTNTETSDGFIYDVYAYPKNYTTLGGAVLKKIDSGDNIALSGAKFAVYHANGDQVTEDYYGNEIGDANHYLTTDSDGYIYVNNLLPGAYYFSETQAPEGYILKSDKYHFTVESGKSTEVTTVDGQLVYDGINLITADNSSKPGISVYVTELNKKEDSVSFGELIRWYIVAGVPSDMGTAYKKYDIEVTLDDELDISEKTIAVTIVSDGIEEAFPDNAYTPSTDGQTLTVRFTDFTALSIADTVKIFYKTTLNEEKTVMGDDIKTNATLNYKTDVIEEYATDNTPASVYTCGYKFKNVSAKDNAPIPGGAEFSLYTGDHNIYIGKVTSDENGEFEFKGLTKGDYYLVQTKASQGYEFKTGKINFTVTKTSYDNEERLPVVNAPASQLPLTGGSGTAAFTVFGLALIALSAIIFAASKKSKRESI